MKQGASDRGFLKDGHLIILSFIGYYLNKQIKESTSKLINRSLDRRYFVWESVDYCRSYSHMKTVKIGKFHILELIISGFMDFWFTVYIISKPRTKILSYDREKKLRLAWDTELLDYITRLFNQSASSVYFDKLINLHMYFPDIKIPTCVLCLAETVSWVWCVAWRLCCDACDSAPIPARLDWSCLWL